ncbi:hypothetical protein L284_09085 [Novosphingobium lindaniclasticum LE124]|uniref:Uncharacterized protein n=1 Tax=Novosphingobium lindaniclasticum LE124 TaxID=1096930 RepID=T0HXN6_9SPHN|nr:hypothetical protein L284_09085 [Novosphingobium lindaniclasticum LE124]
MDQQRVRRAEKTFVLAGLKRRSCTVTLGDSSTFVELPAYLAAAIKTCARIGGRERKVRRT